MRDLEKEVDELKRRLDAIEPHVRRSMPIGPKQEDAAIERQRSEMFKKIVEGIKLEDVPPVDRSQTQLTDGSAVTDDHREINPVTGMQKGYVVLSPEERAKGFVRPVRRTYKHVGAPGPALPLRDLTEIEKERWAHTNYIKFEEYNDPKSPAKGRFWTQEELDKIDKGCGAITTMGISLAETYARDPKFYGGTFCTGCGTHHPVKEFIWLGTNERVDS